MSTLSVDWIVVVASNFELASISKLQPKWYYFVGVFGFVLKSERKWKHLVDCTRIKALLLIRMNFVVVQPKKCAFLLAQFVHAEQEDLSELV